MFSKMKLQKSKTSPLLLKFLDKVISLGKRILRTETVALQVSSIIMYELENGGNK